MTRILGVACAILGVILPEQTGVEVATVASISFPITPVTFALYGVLAVGGILGGILLVVSVLSQFDDDAM